MECQRREAIKSYDKALEIEPNRNAVLIKKGIGLNALQRFGEAIEHFDQVLQDDSNISLALYNRANSRVRNGQITEALTDLEKAVNIEGNKYRQLAKTEKSFESIKKQ